MILRSARPDLSLPDTDFSSYVLERAHQLPNKLAMINADTGETITYGQLIAAIDATASSLVAHGLRQGDVVAVCGFNSPAYAVAVHAIWRAGGVVVTMNPLFTVHEMEQQLTDAGARYLLAAPEVIERAVEAAGRTGLQAILATCGSCETEISQRLEPSGAPSIVQAIFAVGEAELGLGITSIVRLASGQHPPPRTTVNPGEDAALILYSSGTTGPPKGVMLTHCNLIAAMYQLESGDVAREDDVLVAIAPFIDVVTRCCRRGVSEPPKSL
jgi:acyl-CoA synthetase (AMP-forming)/AMP-acid ligase II